MACARRRPACLACCVLAALAGACAFVRYRRRHLRWGATRGEAEGSMPGDDLVPESQFTATRAVTIAAPPEDVWPWIVQVGFGRAGFYSYDLLDNLGRPSAETILPEYQEVRPGDLAAPMADPPTEATSFRVAAVVPERELVWAKPGSTWAWRLTPDGAGGTRLVTRLKQRYDLRDPATLVTIVLSEVGDFPMMRKMLLGIVQRAETHAAARRSAGAPPRETDERPRDEHGVAAAGR